MPHLEVESKQLMWRHLRTVLQTRLSAIALLIPKWTQGKALVQYNGWNNLIVTCIQSHRKKRKKCYSLRISSVGYLLGTAATEQIPGSTPCSPHICLFSFYLVHLSLCCNQLTMIQCLKALSSLQIHTCLLIPLLKDESLFFFTENLGQCRPPLVVKTTWVCFYRLPHKVYPAKGPKCVLYILKSYDRS